MTKDQRNNVAEYATQLSDDELRWLGLRLTERLGGDLGEAVEFLSKNEKIDAYLKTTNTADELFEATERIREVVTKECKKRGLPLKWGPIGQ